MWCIESCGLAGWVHDVCTAEGYEVLVCNPNQEAWKWKHIKRKTDRDDALSWPSWPRWISWCRCTSQANKQREYRRLVKYRKVILGRMNRVQNNIRCALHTTWHDDGAWPKGMGVGAVG